MYQERTGPAVPGDADYYMTLAQQLEAGSMSQFGWEIAFIRRQPEQDHVVVMQHPDSGRYVLLAPDGEIVHDPVIDFRA